MTPDELATQKMLTSLATDIAEIKTIVKQDHKTIHGNGQPGLIERVSKLETKVGIIAAGAGILCSVVAEVIKYFFFR